MTNLPPNLPPAQEARFRRLVISQFDFGEALEVLDKLIAHGEVTDAEMSEVFLTRRVLSIAAVVAYARPFSKNFGAPQTLSRLDIDEVAGLSGPERAMHGRVMGMRDQAVAHSDAEVVNLEYDTRAPNDLVTRITDARSGFALPEAIALRALAWHLAQWTGIEAARLVGRSIHIVESARRVPGTG